MEIIIQSDPDNICRYPSANIIRLYVPINNSSYGTVRVSINNGCGSPSPFMGVTVFPGMSCNYMTAGNFKIYPNPSDGELNVEYLDEKKDPLNDTYETEIDGVFKIEIYNKNEKLVKTADSKNGKVNLETKDLQPGTYFLQIHFGKEVLRKQILIK